LTFWVNLRFLSLITCICENYHQLTVWGFPDANLMEGSPCTKWWQEVTEFELPFPEEPTSWPMHMIDLTHPACQSSHQCDNCVTKVGCKFKCLLPFKRPQKQKPKKYYDIGYIFFSDHVQFEVAMLCCWSYRKSLLISKHKLRMHSISGYIYNHQDCSSNWFEYTLWLPENQRPADPSNICSLLQLSPLKKTRCRLHLAFRNSFALPPGNSSQNRRLSHQTAPGVIKTWIPSQPTFKHGQRSAT
jgi:hypothetical protein